jgi:hypothetical protein
MAFFAPFAIFCGKTSAPLRLGVSQICGYPRHLRGWAFENFPAFMLSLWKQEKTGFWIKVNKECRNPGINCWCSLTCSVPA